MGHCSLIDEGLKFVERRLYIPKPLPERRLKKE
jgi:hypothetical protein